MLNPVYGLVPSFIWAFSPIYYRVFMKRFDSLTLNLIRTSTASLVLLLPALYFGFGHGFYYALASGAVTLAVGDTLFLRSIREMGASVAAPVVYTYVLFVQLAAPAVGEVVPLTNFLAAAMVIAGVYILSRDKGGKPRAKGIAFGIGAGLVWTVGQELIKVATNTGGSVVTITFGRNAAAAVGIGLAVLASGRLKRWPEGVTAKELAFVAFIAATDLVVGSLFFVYSISLVGLALTVILTSLSPLLTQAFSKALGKESPSRMEFLGGVIIVAALVLAVAL
ncbi:MAG: DMT family transporter [Nitrososphaerales archaeon]|nr:DMT family transporter [Nitrososphaerales archaeon]